MLEEIMVLVEEDKPGVLAEIGEVLGRQKVNIETLAASNYGGQGVVHIVVDDGEDASETLQANGFTVTVCRPVMAVTLDDRPGEFGRYCRKLTAAGVDISAVYLAKRTGGETELIFAVDDLQAAQGA